MANYAYRRTIYSAYEDVSGVYRIVHVQSGREMLDFPIMEAIQAEKIARALNDAYGQGWKDAKEK